MSTHDESQHTLVWLSPITPTAQSWPGDHGGGGEGGGGEGGGEGGGLGQLTGPETMWSLDVEDESDVRR